MTRVGAAWTKVKGGWRAAFLIPVLAFAALGAWALASPVGASPDDDFHLVSTWCANGNPDYCQPGDASNTRVVPESLLRASCFAFDADKSAACQTPYLATAAHADTMSKRGNFVGAYPPVFYKVMGLFAGDDIAKSVVIMRLVNAALFVALGTLLYLLLPALRRPTLVWGWLLTTMPLGLFLIASNNPSGWAVTGVGTAWLALLGYYETSGRRRIALGAIFAFAVAMAAGARADAAFYAVVGIGVVGVVTFRRDRTYFVLSILPALAIVGAAFVFLTSRQAGSGLHGFSGSSLAAHPELAGIGLLAYNILNVPFLWTGVFGGWGLGWLDTTLPDVVLWSVASAFIGAGFVGLSKLDRRKAFAIIGVAALLVLIPVYVLTRGGDAVGSNVQPRYLLPLIVLFGGVLLLSPQGKEFRLSRVQTWAVVAALVVANFVSLEANIRRYVTGIDQQGLNLDAGREWWWNTSLTPDAVWLLGSLVYAAAVVLVVREISPRRATSPSASASAA